jgi:Na+-driven multidrug efflux pump
MNSFWLEDVAFLAALGRGHLASASLGTSIFLMIWSFLEGLLTAQDTLTAHSFGMSDLQQVRYWTYIAAIVSVLVCIIATIIFIFSRIITITILFVNYHVASKAALHIITLIPAFWCLAGYRIQQKFLQSQNIMMPSIYCNIVGNIVNIILDYLLMFTFGIGFIGCAIATSISKFIMLLMMTYYVSKTTDTNIIHEEVKYIVGPKTTAFFKRILVNLSTIGSKVEAWCLKTVLNIKSKTKYTNNNNDDDEEVEMGLLSTKSDNHNNNDNNNNNDEEEIIPNKRLNSNYINNNQSTKETDLNDIELDEEVQTKITTKMKKSKKESQILKQNKILNKKFGFKKLMMGSLRFALMGIPGGIMMGLETWYLHVTVIFIAHIGTVALSAHTILLTITSFWYISVPFAISTAITVRLGNLLGAGSHKRGRISSFVAIFLGFCAMSLVGIIVYFMARYIGTYFTDDTDVLYRMEELAPFVAVFSVCQGIHTCCSGIMRAIGKQKTLAVLNLVFLNLIGLGSAVFLAFIVRPTYGLGGFWYGILIGMGSLLFFILLLVIVINWELEVKRALHRLDRLRGVDGVDTLPMPRPGSLAVGGIDLYTESGYDELIETENILSTTEQND